MTAKSAVLRNGKADAEMVTGAKINSANGLLKPPLKYKSTDNWVISNNSVSSTPTSERRLLGGNSHIAPMLKSAEAATPIRHIATSNCRPTPHAAPKIATSWPTIATQRNMINTRSRSQSLLICGTSCRQCCDNAIDASRPCCALTQWAFIPMALLLVLPE